MLEAMIHAKCLRAIGQDLEIKRVTHFSLKSSDDGYLLSVPLSVTERAAAMGAAGDEETSQKVSSPEPIEFLYTRDAIERLDEMGRTKRGMGNGMPDFFSLSQCLRAIGTVVDSKRGQLLQIDREAQLTNATPSFSFNIRRRRANVFVKTIPCQISTIARFIYIKLEGRTCLKIIRKRRGRA